MYLSSRSKPYYSESVSRQVEGTLVKVLCRHEQREGPCLSLRDHSSLCRPETLKRARYARALGLDHGRWGDMTMGAVVVMEKRKAGERG